MDTPKAKTDSDRRFAEVVSEIITLGKVRSERALAIDLGLTPATLYKVRTGIQSFPRTVLPILGEKFGVNLDYIRQGTEPMFMAVAKPALPGALANATAPGLHMIPYVPAPALASFISQYQTGHSIHQFDKRPIIVSEVLGQPKNFFLIDVEGDSMAPTLLPQDQLLISPIAASEWKYLNNGVYVVVLPDHMLVKRLSRNRLATMGTLVLSSDNPDGGMLEVNGEDLQAIFQIKQVIRNLI